MTGTAEKQILEIHSAFVLEYSRATRQLSEFYDVVNSFFIRIISENYENGEYLQDSISKIQDVCFFLKTFCSETELHTQLLKVKTKDEAPISDAFENDVVLNVEYKPPENLNELYPFELYPEIFTYDTIDPAKYMVGFEAEFYIAFIKDNDNLLFFSIIASCSKIVIKKPEFRYDVIPAKGVIFGILLDGTIVRAVRENELKKRPISFKIFLIDFGEILEITKDYKMYQLPEEIQNIPGQAIFCKLVTNDDENCDQNYLEDILHSKQKIRVERVYKNMLEVTFASTKTANGVPSPEIASLNPFFLDSENSSVDLTPKYEKTNKTTALTPTVGLDKAIGLSTISPNIEIYNNKPTETIAPASSSSQNNQENEPLTQEQIDALYEEPLNTENALEAVMGYVPQDEKRICKFYDPKTNACFKGAHCKLEHTTILKDGWTKDKAVIKLTIHSQIPMPKVGTKFNLLVSYVVDVETFYGQIIPKSCKNFNDLLVEEVLTKMNNTETVSKYKKFTQPPGEFELVFALFTDNLWYRARILKKDSDIQYRIFYVDYGNCSNVTLDQLRKWEDSFDRYPFQALKCRLDNVTKIKECDKDAIAYFEKLVLTKAARAHVTCNIDALRVTLDRDGYDIGHQLCAAQFAKPKPIMQLVNGQLPG